LIHIKARNYQGIDNCAANCGIVFDDQYSWALIHDSFSKVDKWKRGPIVAVLEKFAAYQKRMSRLGISRIFRISSQLEGTYLS
jgi:hypothetical protein